MKTRISMVSVFLLLGMNAAGASPLDDLAKSGSKESSALVLLGNLYLEANNLEEAKNAFRAALKASPKSAEAQSGMARVEMALGNFENAKRSCLAIARRGKTATDGDICSGWFWLANDRAARAVEEFQKALDKGDKARGKLGMGEVQLSRGDFTAAAESFRESSRIAAGYVASIGLGRALLGLNDRPAAIDALKVAVASRPESCLAHLYLGQALEIGEEAIRHLKTALEIRPKWPVALTALGGAYVKSGDYANAVASYEAALLGQGSRGEAYSGLGQAYYKMGNTDKALENLKSALLVNQGNVGAHLLSAELLLARGDQSASLEALEGAIKAGPTDYQVYLSSGEIHYKLSRYTSARSFLNQAISYQPKLSRAFALLGNIACERSLYESGQLNYDHALAGDLVGIDKADILKRKAACKPKK